MKQWRGSTGIFHCMTMERIFQGLTKNSFCPRVMFPSIPQKTDPVPGENVPDIVSRIASAGEETSKFLKVGDGVQIAYCLFVPIPPIEIRADPGMAGIPCDLTDVVNVVRDGFQARRRDLLGGRNISLPLRIKHPCITRSADHTMARDDRPDHVV